MQLRERDELFQLHKECDAARKLYKELELQLTTHLITYRNSVVTAKLQEDYQKYAGEEPLKVFCVSNPIYENNRDKPIGSSLPLLELSGIIDLRRHCVGVVADSHLRATVEYIKVEIPSFVSSVELWTQAGSENGSAEKKDMILKAVAAVQQELDKVSSITT